jgi:NAD(P)-dependent dehydrogenase (short-subunit alcohol dehydrogenase family)
MEQAFAEQVALVTGAGSAHGIGSAVAVAFTRRAHVVITSTTRRIYERA